MNPPENDNTNMTEKERYFSSLRVWLMQAQVFQELISSFPYYFLACQTQNGQTVNPIFFNNNYQPTEDVIYTPVFDNANLRLNLVNRDNGDRPRRERRDSEGNT